MLNVEQLKHDLHVNGTALLKFTDKAGFINNCSRNKTLKPQLNILELDELIVKGIGSLTISFKGVDTNTRYISFENYKYFSIKEPRKSFNDVIDTAVKALKDKKLNHLRLTDNEIGFIANNIHYKLFDNGFYRDSIDVITTLYDDTKQPE